MSLIFSLVLGTLCLRTVSEEPLVVEETDAQDQGQKIEEVVVSSQDYGDLKDLLEQEKCRNSFTSMNIANAEQHGDSRIRT